MSRRSPARLAASPVAVMAVIGMTAAGCAPLAIATTALRNVGGLPIAEATFQDPWTLDATHRAVQQWIADVGRGLRRRLDRRRRMWLQMDDVAVSETARS